MTSYVIIWSNFRHVDRLVEITVIFLFLKEDEAKNCYANRLQDIGADILRTTKTHIA